MCSVRLGVLRALCVLSVVAPRCTATVGVAGGSLMACHEEDAHHTGTRAGPHARGANTHEKKRRRDEEGQKGKRAARHTTHAIGRASNEEEARDGAAARMCSVLSLASGRASSVSALYDDEY
jgi:hypothetical protein